MLNEILLKRTTASDPDFQALIAQLDHELWNELHEDQATYDPHNKVDHISTAVVAYDGQLPVASGCFKESSPGTAEIKRMFVAKACRGRGLSKKILSELERWAVEKGFNYAVLETSIHFTTARRLYESSGYVVIPNYGVYAGLSESVCMQKKLKSQ